MPRDVTAPSNWLRRSQAGGSARRRTGAPWSSGTPRFTDCLSSRLTRPVWIRSSLRLTGQGRSQTGVLRRDGEQHRRPESALKCPYGHRVDKSPAKWTTPKKTYTYNCRNRSEMSTTTRRDRGIAAKVSASNACVYSSSCPSRFELTTPARNMCSQLIVYRVVTTVPAGLYSTAKAVTPTMANPSSALAAMGSPMTPSQPAIG